jgi:high-affinity nickel-transport protein
MRSLRALTVLPARFVTRRPGLALLLALLALNACVWVWALTILHRYPLLLGTAVIAYGFGLRHAVDADHIAAIDSVTRKLVHDRRRPLSVGLFFSLGHSTIVVGASAALAASAMALRTRFDAFHATGEKIGMAVSALFLLCIALANLAILADMRYRARTHGAAAAARHHHASFGLLTRLTAPLLRCVQRGWHMYFVGLLFGLGFDTATEIGVLSISASQAAAGLPMWALLAFPALFTAGMALVDTADSVMMTDAYGWAMREPARKLRYNMCVTLLSALAALGIGGIEAVTLIGAELHLDDGWYAGVSALNDRLGNAGMALIALFGILWAASRLYHVRHARPNS